MPRYLGAITPAAGWIAAAVGAVGSLAWASGMLGVAQIAPGYVPMAPVTAAVFLLLGLELALRSVGTGPAAISFSRSLAWLGTALAGAIAVEWLANALVGTNADVEAWVVPAGTSVGGYAIGRVSPFSALLLVVLGVAASLAAGRRRDTPVVRLIVNGLASAVLTVAFLLVLGYAYGAPFLYGGSWIPVALPTAVATLVLAVGLLFDGAGAWFHDLLTSDTVTARLVRLVVPGSMAAILGGGGITVALLGDARSPSHVLGVTATALLSAVVVAALAVVVARHVETAAERAAAALRIAEAQWTTFLEVSPDPMWIKDRGGRYVAVNDAYSGLWQLDRLAILGRTDEELTTPERAASFAASDRIVRETGYHEAEFTETFGGRTWVCDVKKVRLNAADGSFAGTLGLARDITAMRRAAESVRESEARLRLVTDNMLDMVSQVDDRFVFTWVSPSHQAALGYRPDDLLGRSALELIHPDDVPQALTIIERGMSNQEPQVAEIRFLHADGSYRWLEVHGAFLFDDQGRPTAATFSSRDVTSRREVEGQLIHAQRMEAVGTLAGGVAHDFNNLLQAMLGLIDVIGRDQGLPVATRNALAELAKQVRRGAALTRQLLLFSRRETTKPEPCELGEVVTEAVTLLRRLLPADVAVTVATPSEPAVTVADRGQLEQVVMNLAVNAADAMPDGGELTVRVVDLGAEWVGLEVSDTGHGIPDEVCERIFDPFFTTKELGKGTGLGLSVVHGIVVRHGGRIEVESRVGAGTTFRIALPRGRVAIETPRATPEPVGELPPGRGERILVVEDEPAARETLRELLEALGYRVTAVASGEEAGLLPSEPAFDLLLTDVLLPGVHGGDLARGLGDRWPELKVILMSGYTEDVAVKEGVSKGSERFLQKPFDLATLAREVAAALHEH